MSDQSVISRTRGTGYEDDEVGVRRQVAERLPVVAAVAFVALFIAAMVLVIPYDTDQDDAALIADVEDNNIAMMIGIYAAVLSGLAFLVVAGALVRRLAASFTDAEITVARGAAMLGVVGLALGPSIVASPGPADLFGDEGRPLDPGFIRFINSVGFVTLLIVGGLAIALFLGLVARAGRRSGVVPTWFVVLTYLTVVAMVFAPIFFPMVLLLVWALGAAVVLAKPRATET
jgi:hypothetical protein